MSSAAEFCVFLVGTDVLADQALHRHLRRQYTVHCVGRAAEVESRELSRIHRYLSRELKFDDEVIRHENDSMTRALQEIYQFDKLVFMSTPRPTPYVVRPPRGSRKLRAAVRFLVSDKMAEVCNKLAVHAVKVVGDCVAMQRQDTLLVADSGNNRVLLWPLATDEGR